MTDERSFSYHITVDTSMLNEHGVLTPESYQRMIITVIEKHLTNIRLDVPYLMERYGVSWALLSITLEVRAAIHPGEELVIRTWNVGRSGVAYRREVGIYSLDGEPLAAAATFSVIFDTVRRRIQRDQVFETDLQETDIKLLEAESRFRAELPAMSGSESHTVRPSWIDALGHVNNIRYGELVYDALPEEKRARMGNLSRMEMYFTGELRNGERVDLMVDDGQEAVMVEGIRGSDMKRAFVSKLYFDRKTH